MFDETIVEKWRKENLAMNEGVEPEKIVTEKVSTADVGKVSRSARPLRCRVRRQVALRLPLMLWELADPYSGIQLLHR